MPSRQAIKELESIVGKENILTSPEDLTCYSYDGTFFSYKPELVVSPGDAEQVVRVMAVASQNGIPVVPRGGGTNVVGASLPVQGGIVMPMHRLNAVLEIDAENLTARVQPGVVTADLHRAVEALGLFYPPDPSSRNMCTMGGNVAMNASGPRGFKYGVTRDYVLGLTVVLADGRVLKTGGKTIKNVSGYDLTALMVGSEGTLGVVTEITVRLLPLPEAKQTLLAVYEKLEDGAQTVSAVIREKIIPTTLELMDQEMVELVERFKPCGLPLDAGAVILIEVDGSPAEVERQSSVVQELCRKYGAQIKVAANQEEAERLWAARRSAMGATAGKSVGHVSEDTTVPRNKIPAFIRQIKEISRQYDIPIPISGHTGDGNLHPSLLTDIRDPDKMERTDQAVRDLLRLTLDLGGTLTGEHGIGTLKQDFMLWEHGEVGLAVMRAIKQALDPQNILNPGKILGGKHDA